MLIPKIIWWYRFFFIVWTLIPFRSFIHKNEKYIKIKNETLNRRRTSYIVISHDRTGEWNHLDTHFATAITINLPGPTLSQQKVELLYFILHTAVLYVFPRQSVKFKFYLTDKSIHFLFTLIWILTCPEESYFPLPLYIIGLKIVTRDYIQQETTNNTLSLWIQCWCSLESLLEIKHTAIMLIIKIFHILF